MADASVRAPIGLVAGSGSFPLAFVRAMRAAGRPVVVVAHHGETDRAIESLGPKVTWVRVGQLGHILEAIKAGGCSEAVLLGGISKTSFFDGARLDVLGAKLLARVAVRTDDNLLLAIAGEFDRQGVPLVSGVPWLTECLAPSGVLGKLEPTDEERADVHYGFALAKNLGHFDVGQTVVVKDRAPIALEAIEGTDACIERGGKLARSGAVVVKVVKPKQDQRFDLPAAGPKTVEVCAANKIRVLAVEAGRTLLTERAEMIALADRKGVVLMGVSAADAASDAVTFVGRL